MHYASALSAQLQLDAATPPTFAHSTTFAADLGYTSLFVPLITAGCTAIVSDRAARDPILFWREVAAFDINWLKTTPSHFRSLLEARPESAPLLSGLVLGGESLTTRLARKIVDRGVTRLLVNHYGPAETTIGAACQLIHGPAVVASDHETVPIGTALGANRLRLDTSSPTCAADEGELIVSGPGVAAGYFRASPFDDGRFVTDEHQERAYRTGDICRERSPGVFEFLRRADRQIKVRGYRVDPEQVEAAIESIHYIGQAVVLARVCDGAAQLVAAVVPTEDASPDAADTVARHLAATLPNYLVPFAIVPVTAIPLTANGKRDVRQLSAEIEDYIAMRARRAVEPPAARHGFVPALTSAIVEAWSSILGVAEIAPSADIFQLGADSLSCMRLVSRLRVERIHVDVESVLASRTPIELAARATRLTKEPHVCVPSLQPEEQRDKPLAPAQRRFFALSLAKPNLWNQAVLLRSSQRITSHALAAAAADVCAAHPLLHQRFDGGTAVSDSSAVDSAACFSTTELPPEPDTTRTISTVASELQRVNDLCAGRVFRVHLFAGSDDVEDRVLVIVHHLVTDVVSWHVILDDLTDAYAARLFRQKPRARAAGDFWTWTQTVSVHPGPASRTIERLPIPVSSAHGVTSRVLTWSRAATDALLAHAVSSRQLDGVLWSALSEALSATFGRRRLTIDVEQHGRPLDEPQFAGTVGWFTRIHSVTTDVPFTPGSFAQSLAASRPSDGGDTHADVLVNYVGRFDGVRTAAVDWTPSPELFGPLRDASDRPVHAIAVTARLTLRCLVVDAVFDRSRIGSEQIERIVSELVARVGAEHPNIRVVDGSTTGLVALAPEREPERPTHTAVVNARLPILLTGSTGFLGLHLLRAFIVRGSVPTLLVRASSDSIARTRLLERYTDAFGPASVNDLASLHVVAVNLSSESFKPETITRAVDQRPAAIVHAAADTRLFARLEDLRRSNVIGTARMLRVGEFLGCPPFHHVSTLAVAGYHPAGAPRTFTEDDFDYGQSFLTPYEETKFEAERLVRRAASAERPSTYTERATSPPTAGRRGSRATRW